MTHDPDRLARPAYGAYAAYVTRTEATRTTGYSWPPLPAYDDLSPSVRDAWRAAAHAVADVVRADLADDRVWTASAISVAAGGSPLTMIPDTGGMR